MGKTIRPICAIAALMACVAGNALPVEIEGRTVHSEAMGRDVTYSVILPEGYNSGERYPVVYLLHGIGGDHSSWLEYGNMARTMQAMTESGEAVKMIAVMPDGYLSYYSDAADGSLPYERFFTEELMMEVDRLYPTLSDREHRAIAGFSMGGFGALTLGLRSRDKFCAIAALSPSIRTDEQFTTEGPQEGFDKQWGVTFGCKGLEGDARLTDYYKARSPYHIIDTLATQELAGMAIMIDTGDEEGSLTASNEQLHRRMAERGIAHSYRVRNGGHDFECWNAAMPEALRMFSDRFGAKTGKLKKRPAAQHMSSIKAGSSEVWLPAQNSESHRKYPVIYLTGRINRDERIELVSRADSMIRRREIAPVALCFLGDDDTPAMVEEKVEALRGSQRMRALVATEMPVEKVNALHRDENLFTSVVLNRPKGSESEAAETVEIIKKHKRYPRLWIEQRPDAEDYALASALHVMLRENDLSHEYRVATPKSQKLMPDWEEWLRHIMKRIHI